MDVKTAVQYINDIKYMPGWKVYAWEAMTPGHVGVNIHAVVPNSARELAPLGYPSKINAGDDFLLNVTDLNLYQIDDAVIKFLLKVHEHEAREFFRHRNWYNESWVAPYHPHRIEGQARWEQMS